MELSSMLAVTWRYYAVMGLILAALIVFYVVYRRKQGG